MKARTRSQVHQKVGQQPTIKHSRVRKTQISSQLLLLWPTGMLTRPGEIFWRFWSQWFLNTLGHNLSALAISGHSERISPGKIRSEAGRPGGLFKAIWHPTLEHILPGEILSEWHEIARALRFWLKFFKIIQIINNLQKNSRGLKGNHEEQSYHDIE